MYAIKYCLLAYLIELLQMCGWKEFHRSDNYIMPCQLMWSWYTSPWRYISYTERNK